MDGSRLTPLVPGKSPAETRVVVAMSGGVDSSVVAALYADAGYEVIGITLQLYDHGAALARKGACCAGRDIHDARRVAESMGFPHYVLDYESRFREAVMDDFADQYLLGATPIPCVRCNQRVKFRDLLAAAQELEADCLATGHYVQRVEGEHGAELHVAADLARDQSYFLFATTQEQLDFLRFPLGGIENKAETRALAERLGLPVADKPDSQDICFVPNGNYVDVIERLRPGAAEPGEIVDLNGEVLGVHKGIIHYTVGQRRGLGIGGGAPLHVIRLDPERRQVVVGPRHALGVETVSLKDVNWLGESGLQTDYRVRVKVRSTRPPTPARLTLHDENAATVKLDCPEEGVAPGQACVFYGETSNRVLGGGWIAATQRAA